MNSIKYQELAISLLLIVLTWGMKVKLAGLGHNFDIDSYQLVTELLDSQRSVYAHTERYNYGPAWMYTLYGLRQLTTALGLTGQEAFHQVIAGFLALIDVLIAGILRSTYGKVAGLIFLLNPVSLLLTGFHSQFDNIALSLGFLGMWLLIAQPSGQHRSLRALSCAGLCLSISLIYKHILFLFPVWLLLSKQFKTTEKIWVGILPVSLFFMSFLPWKFDPASWEGIKSHVFHYSSIDGNALLPHVIRLFIPHEQVARYLGWIPLFSSYKFCFVAPLLGLGYVFRKQSIACLLPYYLLVTFVTTSAIASQYFMIGVVIAAIFWQYKSVWLFWPIAMLIIAGKPENIGGLPDYRILNQILAWFEQHGHINYYTAQIPFLLLLVSVLCARQHCLTPR